jgi:hypothetical protein
MRSAFAMLHRQGKLTARAHFAVLIDLDKGATPHSAVAGLMKQQNQGTRSGLALRHSLSYSAVRSALLSYAWKVRSALALATS